MYLVEQIGANAVIRGKLLADGKDSFSIDNPIWGREKLIKRKGAGYFQFPTYKAAEKAVMECYPLAGQVVTDFLMKKAKKGELR